MTEPIRFPDPPGGNPPGSSQPGSSLVPGGLVPGGLVPGGLVPGGLVPGEGTVPGAMRNAGEWRHAVVRSLAVVAGTATLGVCGGFLWAVVAPRAALVEVGRGAADVVNSETNAFIAADGWYCVICVVGGVISGLLGYRLAVRRYGPVGMAGVLIGALAAGLITLWIGEQSGLGTFNHQLATLPAGAYFRAQLTLGSRGAIALWPLAAGLMAGGIELMRGRRQAAAPLTHAARGYPGAPQGFVQGGPSGRG
jgi:hypothetical protein